MQVCAHTGQWWLLSTTTQSPGTFMPAKTTTRTCSCWLSNSAWALGMSVSTGTFSTTTPKVLDRILGKHIRYVYLLGTHRYAVHYENRTWNNKNSIQVVALHGHVCTSSSPCLCVQHRTHLCLWSSLRCGGPP